MSGCLTDIATVVSYIIGFEASINEKRSLPENDFSQEKSSVHLVGNSMGGLLAVVFTANYPKVVSSIILNDVGAILPWSGLVSLIGIIGTNAVFNVVASMNAAEIEESSVSEVAFIVKERGFLQYKSKIEIPFDER
jgi:Predicted hydrolases or acyltransferases (alpha/beta hydrolase superfamily)